MRIKVNESLCLAQWRCIKNTRIIIVMKRWAVLSKELDYLFVRF